MLLNQVPTNYLEMAAELEEVIMMIKKIMVIKKYHLSKSAVILGFGVGTE